MGRTDVFDCMAADSDRSESEVPQEDDVQWANQSEYRERTADTDVVFLPDGQMKMKVSLISQTKFASLMQEYGITDMARDLMDVDADADMGGVTGADVEEMDPEEIQELDANLQMLGYIKHVVMPQIVRPEQVHWANPDHVADPDWFDLSELTETDLMHLVAGITGIDPGELIEGVEDRIDKFPE